MEKHLNRTRNVCNEACGLTSGAKAMMVTIQTKKIRKMSANLSWVET